MNKKFAFLLGLVTLVGTTGTLDAAVTVKKAAPVATKSASATESSASLMSTALGLVTSVQELNKKQKELTDECVPSSSDISFVDKMVKEWAKTGAMSPEDIKGRHGFGGGPCIGGNKYSESVKIATTTYLDEVCYDVYNEPGMVWNGYPRVGMAEFCPDGSTTCKNKTRVSNIYDVFNLIDFEEADYTTSEAKTAGKLIAKIENCSDSKLSKRKKELWASFLTTTFSNVGKKTNTADILQQVSGITSSGGGLGGALNGLGGLGGVAGQLFDK